MATQSPANAGARYFSMGFPSLTWVSPLRGIFAHNGGPAARPRASAVYREKCDNSQPMTMHLQIAILAAGEGKRMRSALPKVLHPLGGRPLLAHILGTARSLDPNSICIVHGGDA